MLIIFSNTKNDHFLSINKQPIKFPISLMKLESKKNQATSKLPTMAANNLHFLLVPHIGPGHTIPMIDMAKLLAKQPNVTVTIATTPLNAVRYGVTPTGTTKSELPFRYLELPFPAVEAGLPEGCETTDKIPSIDLIPNFLAAIGMLQQKLEERFDLLIPRPNCIISDKYMSWTGDFADKHQLPRIMFDGMSCFNELCYNNLYVSKVFEGLHESQPFTVPNLPDKIELSRNQLPPEFNPSSIDTSEFRQRARDAEVRAYGVVINSFEELEQEYVNEYKKLRKGKVWCIGPLSLSDKNDFDKSQRGNISSINQEQCLKWLDSQKPESVIYSCFGSLVRVNTPQLIELGLALEASNHPFIWVIRSGDKDKEVEEWLSGSGYEQRIKDRGLIIRGWAPQLLILSHPSIGGFLSHCGWNSTLESVSAGVPMITWPQFAEQFINEKLVVQVLGIGVSVGVDSVVHVGEEDRFGVKVKREDVKKAIEKVMDGGIEGNVRRKRAKEYGKMANDALEEGGSSYLNLRLLIQDILHHTNANGTNLSSYKSHRKMAFEEPQDHQLHFLVIPLMSPGHYIPTIDMAKLLAQHGVKVTIVTTPVNSIRFGSILDQSIQSGLPIHFLELPLQTEKFGLPEGCESLDNVPTRELAMELYKAHSALQQEVEQYIENLNPRPDCIVSGTFLLWTSETSKKFQIPRIIFDGMNCFTQMCNHVLHQTKVYETVSESESFVLPGLPDRIELTRSQLSFAFNNPGSKDVKEFHEKLLVSESEAYGVVVNSFQELEQGYVDEFQKIKEDKAWCVGPLSLCYKDVSEKALRGNKSSISEIECIKWLDSQDNGSVIYACLGSISRIEPDQLVELALALESCKRPFIWVVRAGPKTPKIEQWIEEEGFEERTKGRGLLIRGWAPQLVVLSHPAIGGFLTHCGWNSTLEGVCAGVPMVTWPQFQEQFFNEKLVVEVLRIGVSVGAQNVVHWGEEEKSGVQVKSEDLRKAIEIVMEEGNEGEERRKRAKELGMMAHKAIEEGGSSHKNMTRLIEDIRNQASIKKLS
ncbi:hypothetical protein LXL04_005089 [Taraxacum kok-saghyz]